MLFFEDTSKLKISSRSKELMPEDIFLDNFMGPAKIFFKEQDKEFILLEIPLDPKKLTLLLGIALAILFLYLIFTFWLQVPQYAFYAFLSQANREGETIIRPPRGIIYDLNQKPLVENVPSFDLMLNTLDLPRDSLERQRVIARIAGILKISPEDLLAKITSSEQAIMLVAENLPHEAILQIEEAGSEVQGFYLEKSSVRFYPKGKFSSHILGYVGRISKSEFENLSGYSFTDYIGKEGIERSFEKILRGLAGKILVERDALGRVIDKKVIQEPEPGKNITLWLDSDLQEVLGRALEKSLIRVKAESGAGVILDAKTGGVKALISIPTYDNNIFSILQDKERISKLLIDPKKSLFNRAISGQYLTGSTIKPFIAAAALAENIISPQKLIDVTLGYIDVPNEYNPQIVYRFHDWRVHGWVDMRKAIAVSSNVYFYTIGGGYKDQKGLGPELIKKYLSLFGFGKKTGIDLPGETEGFLPDPTWKKEMLGEPWSLGNTYHYAIGQGYLKATPLQIAIATSAIANGGKLLKPQVVKAIGQQETQVQVLRENFIDPEYLKVIKEGMAQAVEYGSAVLLNDLPVKVGAKTGTAQTSDPNRFHHWVTVFAPYENPEIVLTILIEDVEGLQSATLPVAKEVLQWYFTK